MTTQTIVSRRNNRSVVSVRGKALIASLEDDYDEFTLTQNEARALANWLAAEFGVTGKAPSFQEKFAALKVGDLFTYHSEHAPDPRPGVKVSAEEFYSASSGNLVKAVGVFESAVLTKVD